MYNRIIQSQNNVTDYHIFSDADLSFLNTHLKFIECVEDFLLEYRNKVNPNCMFFKKYQEICTKFNNVIPQTNEKGVNNLIAISILYGYAASNDVVYDNLIYKKRRDIIFKSEYFLNIILDNIYFVTNTVYSVLDIKIVFIHLIGYMEVGKVFTAQLIENDTIKERILYCNIKINITLYTQHITDISRTPFCFSKSPNYPYYLKTNLLHLNTYIRDNNFGHTKLKITNFSVLTKLLNQKFFFEKNILNYAIQLLLEQFKLPINLDETQLLRFIKTNFNYVNDGALTISSNYPELLQIHSLVKFYENYANYENGFYYSYYYDFRGRLYCDSNLNYTNNRWTRHLLHFGQYTDTEINTFLLPTQMNRYWNELFHLSYSIVKNDFQKYYIIQTHYEMGKLIKTTYPNYSGTLSYKNFLELGLNLVNDVNNLVYKLDGLDLFEKNIFLYRLSNYNNLSKYKLIFYRDATASGLQVSSLILKPKNTEVLRWLNLYDSDYWYDTYQYIINIFKKNNLTQTNYLPYFNRKSLKQTIMIFNYQGTYYTCLNNFKYYLNQNTNLSAHQRDEIIKLFKVFYFYLKKIFDDTEIFKYSSNHIYNLIKWSNPHVKVFSDSSNLKYCTTKKINEIQSRLDWTNEDFISEFVEVKNSDYKHSNFGENTFETEVKQQIKLITNPTYVYELKSFFKFLKKANLLKTFRHFFAKNKFLTPINYTNYHNSMGHFTKDVQLQFLNYLLKSNTNSIESVFNLFFDDGFTINYDYVGIEHKKIDVKQSFEKSEVEFFKGMSAKYEFSYSEHTLSNRASLNTKKLIKNIDYEKIDSALKANVIHSFDAYIIRKLIVKSNVELITIHDCFGTHMLALNNCIDCVKDCYSSITLLNSNGDKLTITNDVQSNFILL